MNTFAFASAANDAARLACGTSGSTVVVMAGEDAAATLSAPVTRAELMDAPVSNNSLIGASGWLGKSGVEAQPAPKVFCL